MKLAIEFDDEKVEAKFTNYGTLQIDITCSYFDEFDAITALQFIASSSKRRMVDQIDAFFDEVDESDDKSNVKIESGRKLCCEALFEEADIISKGPDWFEKNGRDFDTCDGRTIGRHLYNVCVYHHGDGSVEECFCLEVFTKALDGCSFDARAILDKFERDDD